MSETNDNSIALLRQIREGNQTAFKGLFDTYFTPLCRFIYYQTNDREASEELTLDIFTYLWDNRATFEIKLSVKAYLFQAARNRAINWLRQQKATVSIDAIDHSDMARRQRPRNRRTLPADTRSGSEPPRPVPRSVHPQPQRKPHKQRNRPPARNIGQNRRGTDNPRPQTHPQIPRRPLQLPLVVPHKLSG